MLTVLRAPTREFVTAVMDSHRWDGFTPRADDIVIATYPKCGTTWTQRIIDLLVFQSSAPRAIQEISPWLDSTIFAPVEEHLATLEAQTHRRFIKSHAPFDSLPVFEGVKYIHVARDGRDACMSMHNHQLGFLPEKVQARLESAVARGVSDARVRRKTPEDPREFYLQWITDAEVDEADRQSMDLPYCEFEMTYWRERSRPNLLFVHYNDLKTDLAGEMARIASFLDIDASSDLMAELAQAASFDAMKRQGDELLPKIGEVFDHGAQRFLNKGVNGRWKDVLTAEDLARYQAVVDRRLSPTAARWLEHGRLVAGDPSELAD